MPTFLLRLVVIAAAFVGAGYIASVAVGAIVAFVGGTLVGAACTEPPCNGLDFVIIVASLTGNLTGLVVGVVAAKRANDWVTRREGRRAAEKARKMMPLMECGHTAQGVDRVTGEPVCVVCLGLHPGARKPVASPPDLTGRIAVCLDCGLEKPSSYDLPFFRLSGRRDTFYCGCRGWDSFERFSGLEPGIDSGRAQGHYRLTDVHSPDTKKSPEGD